MTQGAVHIGKQLRHSADVEVSGHYTTIDNEVFYQIGNYDHMDDFFISLVSDSNHWMFISTRGGLTAGRVNSESAPPSPTTAAARP